MVLASKIRKNKKSVRLIWRKVQNILNHTFCVIMVNSPNGERYFGHSCFQNTRYVSCSYFLISEQEKESFH